MDLASTLGVKAASNETLIDVYRQYLVNLYARRGEEEVDDEEASSPLWPFLFVGGRRSLRLGVCRRFITRLPSETHFGP